MTEDEYGRVMTEHLDGHACSECGTWIGPCLGNKQHGQVVCAGEEDFFDPRVLGETPNRHQYGYCIDCRAPMRWSIERQRWVDWTEEERAAWTVELARGPVEAQARIEEALA